MGKLTLVTDPHHLLLTFKLILNLMVHHSIIVFLLNLMMGQARIRKNSKRGQGHFQDVKSPLFSSDYSINSLKSYNLLICLIISNGCILTVHKGYTFLYTIAICLRIELMKMSRRIYGHISRTILNCFGS